jgi:outer membrane protein
MLLLIITILGSAPEDTVQFTLNQAIEYALEHSPEIMQLEIEHEKSRTHVGQALSAFYPSITATGGYAYITDVPVIAFDSLLIPMGQSENYNVQISLQQVLFAWGKIYSAYRITDINRKITEMNLRRKSQEIRYAVTGAFYNLLVLEEMSKLTRESMTQLQRHAKAVETRYKAGLVSRFDLLRAQVQVANIKPQLIQVENGLQLAREAFKMLLGLELDTEFIIDGELKMIDEEYNLDTLVMKALSEREELKSVRGFERIAQLSKTIARRANLPTIVAGATYERQKPFSTTGDEWGSSIVFNVGFQWTLFNGFNNYYKHREATLQVQEAQLAYDNLKKGITLEVKQAYLSLESAGEVLVTAQENVDQAEMAFTIIETRYKNGLATNLEFMDAQLASMQARTNYLSALKDYYTSRAELFKAIGKEE